MRSQSAPRFIGAVFGFFFVRRQLRRGRAGTTPMLDVRLFKNTVFTGGILANLFAMFVDVGFLFFVSQHLQLVSGYSPMQAGLFLIPGLACTIIAGLYAAKLVSRFHPAVIVSSGLALGALGYLFVVFLGSRNDLLLMLSFMFLGLSVGAAQTISNDLILSSVPANKAGAASAISETGGNHHLCTVNCGQHATDHHGTQHGAELIGGLRNCRRSTGLIRRNAGRIRSFEMAAPHPRSTLGT